MNNVRITDDLKRLLDLRSQLFQLKLSFWQGNQGVNTASFKRVRREIAKIMTLAKKDLAKGGM